jgi:hypothetical protein
MASLELGLSGTFCPELPADMRLLQQFLHPQELRPNQTQSELGGSGPISMS